MDNNIPMLDNILLCKQSFDYFNPAKVILEVSTNRIKTWSIAILVTCTHLNHIITVM